MPPSHEAKLSSDVNTLVFQTLGELKRAVEKLNEEVQTIKLSRASEQGFKTGATWLAKLIWSLIGGVGLLVAQAILKHFGWL